MRAARLLKIYLELRDALDAYGRLREGPETPESDGAWYKIHGVVARVLCELEDAVEEVDNDVK